MTIFVGAFQHDDLFHRIATIVAVSSIVVTAVYILRVVGKILFGPIINDEHKKLTDAVWHEKLPLIVLLIAIVGMGIAPLWISDLILDSLQPIVDKLVIAAN
jgi:NADH-quinone oxidoreductase subunit M